MDYGSDSDSFKNFSRVIQYYNDLEHFLISIQPALSDYESALNELYLTFFREILIIQKEKFLSFNQDKDLSLL